MNACLGRTKNRFRVLHLIRPASGGMKRHFLSLVKGLDRGIFKPVAVCPEGPLAKEARLYGGRVISFPLGSEFSFLNPWTVARLVSVLKKEKPAILHVHGFRAGLVGRLAASVSGTPAVFITVHGSLGGGSCFGKQYLASLVEKMLSKVTDRVIAVSEAIRQELLAKAGLDSEKVVTIFNGINFCSSVSEKRCQQLRKLLGLPASARLVGTVARLVPQKGLSCFLRAASALASASNHQVSFLVVGDGPLRRKLEKEAYSLGLAGRIVFTGELLNARDILPVLDIFVLPSFTEGFPLVLLEALAAGRPVVATSVGGIPEIVTDGRTGFLVKPGDPGELSRTNAILLDDPQKALTIASNGQDYVKSNFSAERMVKSVQEEYVSILRAKGLFV